MYNVGLVLEGGGMRGIFTAGVLDFFIEKGIEFAEIIGVSAGACHACSYVSKQHGRAKAISIDYLDDKRYCSIYSLITTGNLFGEKFAYDDIPNRLNLFDNESFIRSKTRLFATVTNVETGKAEYIELKDLKRDMEALRASASLPLLSRIVEFGDNKYLDGGMADSIPVKQMEDKGFSKNVAILTRPKGYIKKPSRVNKYLVKLRYKRYPKLIEQIENRSQSYNKAVKYIEEQEAKGNIFVIRPKQPLIIDRIEKDKLKLEKVYYIGYECAREKYGKLIEFLENENLYILF